MGRFFTGVLALLALSISGCSLLGDPWEGVESKTRVIVTIPALESFVRGVGGDLVAVKCLCTAVGPHHYEADTADLSAFRKADLFLAIGLTLDDKFARDLYARAHRPDLAFERLGMLLPRERLIKGMDAPGHEGHGHGKWDPHIWLGLPEAVLMVEMIREQLARIDPNNADTFKKNAADYIKKLQDIEQEGKKLKLPKRIITFHESFAYFARTFDIEVAGVIQMGPGDEPTSAEIEQIVELVKKGDKQGKPITHITVEPQYKDGTVKLVQAALKKEGVIIKIVKVDPMETAIPAELEEEGGDWYLNRMYFQPKKGEKKKISGILNQLTLSDKKK